MAREQDRDYTLPARRPETGMSGFREPDFWTASPFQMFRRMQEDMERLWGQFFSGQGSGGYGGIQAWSPSVDVRETENEFVIRADLPGVEPEDVEAFCAEDRVVIRGETRREEEKREQDWLRSERHYGRFERVLPLPAGVKQDAIQASFRNGVLELHIPKTEEARQRMRRIPIQGAGATLAGAKGGEVASSQGQQAEGPQGTGASGQFGTGKQEK